MFITRAFGSLHCGASEFGGNRIVAWSCVGGYGGIHAEGAARARRGLCAEERRRRSYEDGLIRHTLVIIRPHQNSRYRKGIARSHAGSAEPNPSSGAARKLVIDGRAYLRRLYGNSARS